MNRREFLKVIGMGMTIEDLKRVCPEADWQSELYVRCLRSYDVSVNK